MKKRTLFRLFLCCVIFLNTQTKAQELIDGKYYIRSVEDLIAFATRVNNGENTANGVLTCDLDLANSGFTPIGTNDSPYMGHFDGGLFRITQLNINMPGKGQLGFFGTVGGGCVIENLIVESGRVQGKNACAGIIGACRGNAGSIIRITNCGNNAYVTCSAENAAGILGCNYDSGTMVRITNCYNTGIITGAKESASICAWTGGSPGSFLKNCYNAGKVSGMDKSRNLYRSSNDKTTWTNCYDATLGLSKTQGQSLNFTDGRNGRMCHLLGEPFTQNLDEDKYPTFGHRPVIHVSDKTYINEGDTIESLTLKDKVTEIGIDKTCVINTVSYSRTFAEADVWEPLFVPFDSKTTDWQGMTIAQLYDIRQYDDNNDGIMDRGEMEFITLAPGEEVKQNTPYIIKADNAETYTVQTTTPTVFDPETETVSCATTEVIFRLCGNYQPVSIDAGTHALLENGTIAATKVKTTLKPMRWYLYTEEKTNGTAVQIPQLGLKVYEQDVTAIKGLQTGSPDNSAWYDLNGTQMKKPGKGIFVKGGKKYLYK